MTTFLSGVAAALSLVAGLFFLRFHRQSRDRLFLLFGIAFLLLAAGRVLQVAFAGHEEDAAVYVPRLVGFLLIAAGIVAKNRGR